VSGLWWLLLGLLLPAVGVAAWFVYAATHERRGTPIEYESDRSDT
jgi:hypothetical protein